MTLRAGRISLVRATVFAIAIGLVPITQAQSFTVLHNFTGGLDGANPDTGLTMDRAGNLYGTTRYGGLQVNDCNLTNGCGTVFKLARQGSGWIFRPLYQFQGYPSGDGANPLGRVIFGPDGALYGTTLVGGSSVANCLSAGEPGCGTVFKVTPPPIPCRSFTCNWEETQVHNFVEATDGYAPSGEIAFDSAGNLYGTTEGGGPGGDLGGTVYELTPGRGTWTLTVLFAFYGQLGTGNPLSGVQLDQAGNVYGTTSTGGTGDGSVYQLVPSGSGWTPNILNDFQGGFGALYIDSGPIVGPGGNLYAGTSNGNPNTVIYELSPSNGGWTYSVLHTFSDTSCNEVEANLVMDSAGNLYGTAVGVPGDGCYGNVFKLTPSNGGWIYTDLHDFTGGSDGGLPVSSVVVDANGNLYGTAFQGGANGYGVVWEITP